MENNTGGLHRNLQRSRQRDLHRIQTNEKNCNKKPRDLQVDLHPNNRSWQNRTIKRRDDQQQNPEEKKHQSTAEQSTPERGNRHCKRQGETTDEMGSVADRNQNGGVIDTKLNTKVQIEASEGGPYDIGIPRSPAVEVIEIQHGKSATATKK